MTKDMRGGRREVKPVTHNGVTYRTSRECPVYAVWNGMMYRCFNPKAPSFPHYGGRGITVAQELQTLQGFLDVMGLPPGPGYQIDRIDNNGNYEPGNLRWATATENERNKRNNRLVTHNGRTQCLSAWAQEIGVSIQVLWTRLDKYKWTVQEALETPLGEGGRRFGRRSQSASTTAAPR
jgi:hypothetical protein